MRGSSAFLFGFAVGAVGGALLARGQTLPQPMPNLGAWRKTLAQTRGEAEAARLAAQMQARYDALMAGRTYHMNRALRWHIEGSILPGLALYQTLQAESDDRETALAEVETLFAAHGTASLGMKAMVLLKHLPPSFTRFRFVAMLITRLLFPPQGWQIEMVENSDRRLAFNIHSCLYLETLTAYGAPELTALFCKLDDLLYEALPPSIQWARTMTMGRGGAYCNFCWQNRSAVV